MKNPLIPLIWKLHGRAAIAIDPLKCVRCGKCARVCRHHAVRKLDGGGYQIQAQSCVRCYHCKEGCPRQAIGPGER